MRKIYKSRLRPFSTNSPMDGSGRVGDVEIASNKFSSHRLIRNNEEVSKSQGKILLALFTRERQLMSRDPFDVVRIASYSWAPLFSFGEKLNGSFVRSQVVSFINRLTFTLQIGSDKPTFACSSHAARNLKEIINCSPFSATLAYSFACLWSYLERRMDNDSREQTISFSYAESKCS